MGELAGDPQGNPCRNFMLPLSTNPGMLGRMPAHLSSAPLRLLALCPVLWFAGSGLAAGEEVVPEEIAAKAGTAVLSVQQSFKETNTSFRYDAAFLNAEGWAVVPLGALTYRQAPTFRDADGVTIAMRKVLAIDAELMVGLVELDRRSDAFLKLSEQEPEVGEPFALLWDTIDARGVRSGQIVARRKLIGHKPDAPRFLSLGMFMADPIRSKVLTGSPVINAKGELLGIYYSTEWAGSDCPLRVIATPADPIRKLLEQARAHPEGLPFPLAENNPHDEAYWSYNLSPTMVRNNAVETPPLDEVKAIEQKLALLKGMAPRYPDSTWLKGQTVKVGAELGLCRLGRLLTRVREEGALLDIKELDAELEEALEDLSDIGNFNDFGSRDSDPAFLSLEGMRLRLRGEQDKQMALYQKELARWGDDPAPQLLGMIAAEHQKRGNVAEALKTYKWLIELAPDSLSELYEYQQLLIQNRDFDEEQRISELIDRVEAAYRPR